jgi:aspartate dehydrogenase
LEEKIDYAIAIPEGTSVKAGLIGCGNIGGNIAAAFDDGVICGKLSAVYDVKHEKAVALSARLKHRPRVAASFEELLSDTDFVIEAASQDAVRHYIPKALEMGKDVMIMSAGALLDDKLFKQILDAANKNKKRMAIIVSCCY